MEEQVVQDLAKMVGSSFHVVVAPTLCRGHPQIQEEVGAFLEVFDLVTGFC